MWTNKWRKSLYTTLVFRMFLALVISVLIFLTLLLLINVSDDRQAREDNEKKQTAIFSLADDIQKAIKSTGMTIDEARDIRWDEEGLEVMIGDDEAASYIEEFFFDDFEGEGPLESGESPQGMTYNSYGSAYLFEIDGLRSDGHLLIYARLTSPVTYLYIVLSALLSIMAFFIISIRLLRPIFHYIKKIEEGVKVIASEDLTYKVETVGDNELTSLAREINAMGQQIYDKTEKEKKLDKAQRTLITNMSHDLRTPLTSMLGYIDLINKNADSEDKVKDYADTVRKNTLRLEKLINDLFMYNKLTSDDMAFDFMEVDVNTMLRQMLEIRSGHYETDFVGEKLTASLDTAKFHRIMENLLSNAKKYGTEGMPVKVSTVAKDSYIEVSIVNHTADDLSDKINLLSDRMYVANQERQQGSSGLGLSIAKDMTEKMGGEMFLAYEDGVYEVRLQFPLVGV